MSEKGLPVFLEWIVHYSQNRDQFYERLDVMFSSPRRPTALVVSDWYLKSVYDYMNLRHIEIGKEISVISSDGIVGEGLSPKPTTVINSTAKSLNEQYRYRLTLPLFDILQPLQSLCWKLFYLFRDKREFLRK